MHSLLRLRALLFAGGVCGLSLFATVARAALNMNVSNLTTTAITFSLSGSPENTPDGFKNFLYIEAPGVDWISGSTFTTLTSTFVAPLSSSYFINTASTVNTTGSFGDYIKIEFSLSLTTSLTGTGMDVTLTTSPVTSVFDPSKINSLELYWGQNTGDTGQPFGSYQSSVVPEPSAYAAGLGVLAMLMVAIRRRRA